MALYYPLSASLVLFANILSNPQDQHAASDIHLMNLITSFITRSVQPGTSFAATPTLSLFKELYSIAKRLVAKVPPQSSQKMKRQLESEDPAQSGFIPLRGQLVADKSLSSDLNAQTTASYVSSQFPNRSPKDIYPQQIFILPSPDTHDITPRLHTIQQQQQQQHTSKPTYPLPNPSLYTATASNPPKSLKDIYKAPPRPASKARRYPPATAPSNSPHSHIPNRTSSSTIQQFTIPCSRLRGLSGIWLLIGCRIRALILMRGLRWMIGFDGGWMGGLCD